MGTKKELLIVNTIRSFFRMTNFEKPYKTYDELVKILKNRNLDISNTSEAKNLLQLYGFHPLINGYGKSFITKNGGEFQANASLDDIYSLYLIDSEMQELFLTSVLKVERHLANIIGYVVAEHFGIDSDKEYVDRILKKIEEYKKKHKKYRIKSLPSQKSYLYYKNYSEDYSTAYTIHKIVNCIVYSKNNPIAYYRENHNHIPPWILVQNLTFGQIVDYYQIQQHDFKTEIVNEMITSIEKEYGKKTEEDYADQKKNLFYNTAQILSCFRNAAAHTSPLYLFKAKEHIKNYDAPSKETLERYLGEGILKSNEYSSLKTGGLYVALLSLLLLNRDSFQRRLLISKLQSLEQIWKEEPFSEDYKAYKETAGLPDDYVERLKSAHEQLENNEMSAQHPINTFSILKTVFVHTSNTFHLYRNCQYIKEKEIKEIKELSFLEAIQKKYSLCKKCLAKQKSISK